MCFTTKTRLVMVSPTVPYSRHGPYLRPQTHKGPSVTLLHVDPNKGRVDRCDQTEVYGFGPWRDVAHTSTSLAPCRGRDSLPVRVGRPATRCRCAPVDRGPVAREAPRWSVDETSAVQCPGGEGGARYDRNSLLAVLWRSVKTLTTCLTSVGKDIVFSSEPRSQPTPVHNRLPCLTALKVSSVRTETDIKETQNLSTDRTNVPHTPLLTKGTYMSSPEEEGWLDLGPRLLRHSAPACVGL